MRVKYDFDRVVPRRNTNSSKWDNNLAMFGTEDVLDMWVADMDFPCPEPVVRALKKRAEHPIYGYTMPSQSLYQAIIDRMERFYGWKIKKEWIVFGAGVVNGLFTAVQAFCRPGDEVVVQPPVYYPFYNTIRNSGVTAVHNNLEFDGQRYTMDLDGLDNMFAPSTSFPIRAPRIKAVMLCSPHNPVGRIWTREELERLAEICLENRCVIFSDEIHCDLLFKGHKHTVLSTLGPEVEQSTLTFMAASKTFNLAGLGTSFAVVPNDYLRRRFIEARMGHPGGNLFGLEALEAAFRDGDEYLAQLKDYLQGNLEYFMDAIATRIPRIKVIKPEGTYLTWVDMRGLGMTGQELQKFIRFKARLAFDDGFAFGPAGEGFQRVNLGCPRSIVVEAVERLEKAVNEL
jgi:cystathionine beta-lyase